MTTSKTIVISLTSGSNIITEIVGDVEATYLLKHPFELLTDFSNEYQVIQFAKYMPYSDDGLVAISKSAVVSMTVCNERFNNLYGKKVAAFIEANTFLAGPEGDAAMQEAIAEQEGDDEENEESDDYDPSEPSAVRTPKTIH